VLLKIYSDWNSFHAEYTKGDSFQDAASVFLWLAPAVSSVHPGRFGAPRRFGSPWPFLWSPRPFLLEPLRRAVRDTTLLDQEQSESVQPDSFMGLLPDSIKLVLEFLLTLCDFKPDMYGVLKAFRLSLGGRGGGARSEAVC
jgi:hypothetical protein